MKTTLALALLLSSFVLGASTASAQWNPNLVCADPTLISSQYEPTVFIGLPKCVKDCERVATECNKRVKDAIACLTASYGLLAGFRLRNECGRLEGAAKKACVTDVKAATHGDKLSLDEVRQTELDHCQGYGDLCSADSDQP